MRGGNANDILQFEDVDLIFVRLNGVNFHSSKSMYDNLGIAS
jgi:hypothetical protein